VGGGQRRGGSACRSSAVARATAATAWSIAGSLARDPPVSPLTLRTYWRAAASISSAVACGSKPRSVVMFRHTGPSLEVRHPWKMAKAAPSGSDSTENRPVLGTSVGSTRTVAPSALALSVSASTSLLPK
jgi:hypothetical protein